MPRLRNTRTGSVVVVDDATAAGLGPEYEPADDSKAAQTKPTPRRKASASKSA